jgi:hypothetical protein
LLPTSARAASTTTSPAASLPVVVVAIALVAVVGESVAGAEGQGGGCETVREVDLGANGVGEVGNDEDVLDVCVAANVNITYS